MRIGPRFCRRAIFATVGLVITGPIIARAQLSHPLTPEQVACDQAQLERLQHRMVVVRPGQSNLILWRSANEGGQFSGLAVTPGLRPGEFGPRRSEKQLAFDLGISPEGDFLNPRRTLLPQAKLARRSVASNLDQSPDATLEVSLDLANAVPNPFQPANPIQIDSRRAGSGADDGAGRGMATDDLTMACHGELTDFDRQVFEILSRTLRATGCLTVPSFCSLDFYGFNVSLFRGEEPGIYRANIYIYSQTCDDDSCDFAVFARPEAEVTVNTDSDGRLAHGSARFLPRCNSLDERNCSYEGPGPWAVHILPPIWAGNEEQGEEAFLKGGFLNIIGEGNPDNVFTTTFDWSELLAGTAWSGPLR